ncbi:flagellin N-terminal helical domain-containing protein [Parendozoicomonas callyspongiae]|uniref:flagellin N-terminal helical domain-containing protein n=1 Tax=Parendozoicomonas callyspongiae TaxID=2942213 RepID=UPI0024BF0B2C|nr:flagellin [Sansalvadorimonas sp. 2012CJ34-2]
MALSVNTNVPSLTAQQGLERATGSLETSMRRLSTGYRINSAKDDAAGLQITNRMTSQINGLTVAVRNANDGISVSQTAEGAMNESTAILQRMRDLAIQSANDSNDSVDRAALQKEVIQLTSELDRISDTTTFGGQKLLDGTFSNKQFQVGANANETIAINITSVKSDRLGIDERALTFTGFTLLGADSLAAQALTFTVGGANTNVNVTSTSTAKTIANAVSSSVDRVNAIAANKVDVKFETAAAIASGANINLKVNGTTYNQTFSTDKDTTLTALTAKLTAAGLTAAYDSTNDTITLNNTTGDNFVVQVSGDEATSDPFDNNDVKVRGYAADGTTTAGIAVNAVGADVTIRGSVTFKALDGSATYKVASSLGTGSGSFAPTSGGINGIVGSAATVSSVSSVNISDYTGAQRALGIIDAAIADIDDQRGNLGAIQNRFQHTIFNLQSIRENMTASRGRVKDTDYAAEMAEMTKQQILKQASIANLAQANELSRDVLNLLR